MNHLKAFVFLWFLALASAARAQPFFDPLTAAEVEAHLSYLSNTTSIDGEIPDPDSISKYMIRKSINFVKVGSTDGHVGEGKVVTKYDRNGYIKSYRELDHNHPGTKSWSTVYTYSPNYDRMQIKSSIGDSITGLDSVYVTSDGRVLRQVGLLSRYTTSYTYLRGNGPLIYAIRIDSTGSKWITSIQYDSLDRMSVYVQIYVDKTGKEDTLESRMIIRDSLSRIVFAGNFSKYEVTWNVNNPDSVTYWRMGTYYEYNRYGQVTKSTDYNIFSPQGLTHIYTYDENLLLVLDENRINDSVVSKRFHYHNGTTDSVRENTYFSNYEGRGALVVSRGYEIITYNKNGEWLTWKDYTTPDFGITEPIQSVDRILDEHGHVTATHNYSYDFAGKKMVLSNTGETTFYRNGLEREHSYWGKENSLITWSKTKFRYYRWR